MDINNCNDPNYLVIRINNYTISCNSSSLLLLYYMTILFVIELRILDYKIISKQFIYIFFFFDKSLVYSSNYCSS